MGQRYTLAYPFIQVEQAPLTHSIPINIQSIQGFYTYSEKALPPKPVDQQHYTKPQLRTCPIKYTHPPLPYWKSLLHCIHLLIAAANQPEPLSNPHSINHMPHAMPCHATRNPDIQPYATPLYTKRQVPTHPYSHQTQNNLTMYPRYLTYKPDSSAQPHPNTTPIQNYPHPPRYR